MNMTNMSTIQKHVKYDIILVWRDSGTEPADVSLTLSDTGVVIIPSYEYE